jgi:hypothetical protein
MAMLCPYCKNEIPDSSKFCPDCGSVIVVEKTPKKKTRIKGPSDFGKGFSAIATALMVFPATLSVAIDLVFHSNDGWSAYVVGALIVAWLCSVFPALRITPAPVSALIAMFSVLAYISFIISKNAQLVWLYKVGLPLFILAAIFIAVDSALLSSGKVKGLHFLSVLSVEVAVYLLAIEATVDTLLYNMITLRWSIIVACIFISAVALFEAVQYSLKLLKNRKGGK